jgi:DNA-binding response OmpR family regulator
MSIHTPHIFLIDDDLEIGQFLQEYLILKGLKVSYFYDPYEALNNAKINTPPLAVLDINMPRMDGFTLSESLRVIYPDLPFIFLSGLGNKEDRIKGLTLGADDYMVKPFSMEEVYLRIMAIIKRYSSTPNSSSIQNNNAHVIEIGKIQFNTLYQTLEFPALKIKLSAIESKLLTILLENINQSVGKNQLIETVWGKNAVGKDNSLTVYINKLRNLFANETNVQIINQHGEGYKFALEG